MFFKTLNKKRIGVLSQQGNLLMQQKKIVQLGEADNFKLQIAIRDMRYQSYSQDQSQALLSLLQSLLIVIQINLRHIRNIKRLENKTTKQDLNILAPSFEKPLVVIPISQQIEAHFQSLDLSNQHSSNPVSAPATPTSVNIQLNPQNPILSQTNSAQNSYYSNPSSNSDWEDQEDSEVENNSYTSLYKGGEREPNQIFTDDQNLIHIDQNNRKNNQEILIKENLIKVSDSQINKFIIKQSQTIQQQFIVKYQINDQQNQAIVPVVVPHNDKYKQLYQGLLQTQNRTIPFDSFEKYNEIKEKVVSLRIQSSISFLHNAIGEICNALQEIFDNNQIYTIVNLNSYRSNRMDARQLEQYELAALKALLGILVKFLGSDSDAILKIEHQQDNMFNRNTLLFKTLGKTAFSLQKDLNRESANRFKKHIQLKFLGFSTKIFNLNQNLFTRINPNQPNTLLIIQKPKSFRRYYKGFNRKKNNK